MRWLLALICCLCGPQSALAQDIAFVEGASATCASEAGTVAARIACIGRSANACSSTPEGQSNFGMGFCYMAELKFWDARLNAAYKALRAAEHAQMAQFSTVGGNIPDSVSALREMQLAWIAYRDAACVYEFATWGGGTGGGPANAACLMQITGEQALRLEDRLEYRGQ